MPTEPSNKSNKGSESTSKSNVISQYLPFVSNALADGGDRVPVNSMSDQVADVIEETRILSQSAMSISDMREQILANAVQIFPPVVVAYLHNHKTETFKPNEIFDVVFRSHHVQYSTVEAVITHGKPTKCEIDWVGDPAGTVQEALALLLQSTGERVNTSLLIRKKRLEDAFREVDAELPESQQVSIKEGNRGENDGKEQLLKAWSPKPRRMVNGKQL